MLDASQNVECALEATGGDVVMRALDLRVADAACQLSFMDG
jgi:hypothetical protein